MRVGGGLGYAKMIFGGTFVALAKQKGGVCRRYITRRRAGGVRVKLDLVSWRAMLF